MVLTVILELPSANVSIVPEPEFAEAIGIAEKVLNIIISASMTERVALACTGVRVRASSLRTISGGYVAFGVAVEKKPISIGEFGDGICEGFAIVGVSSENHKVTIATIKITPLLVGIGQVTSS